MNETEYRPFDNVGDGGVPGFHDISELMCRPNSSIGLMLIDASGSMEQHGDAPVKALQLAIEALKKDDSGRQYFVGIMAFNTRMTVLVQVMEVHRIGEINGYKANGDTRLFGTVQDGLTYLMAMFMKAGARVAPDLSISVGVFSDGMDNRSPEALPLLHELCKSARGRGWSLHTFGIGIDSAYLARLLGFDPDFALTVPATEEGMGTATTTFSHSMLSSIQPNRTENPGTDQGIRSDP